MGNVLLHQKYSKRECQEGGGRWILSLRRPSLSWGPIIMSSLCQSVEWGFGKLLQLFPFLDYKKNLKLFLQPVAKYYMVANLLANAHTCLYGSQISNYFGLNHPKVRGIPGNECPVKKNNLLYQLDKFLFSCCVKYNSRTRPR